MADEMIFTTDGTNRVTVSFRDVSGSAPRERIRVALNSPIDFYADSVLDLPGDSQIDLLDWVEVMVCFDLDVGVSSWHCYLNHIDKTGTATLTTVADVNWDTAPTDMTLGATATGTLPLGGSLQEVWCSAGYVDWSVQVNREAFTTQDGQPKDISNGGLYDAGLGVAPFLYIKGKAGFDATDNLAPGVTGDFAEIGSVTDEGTYPLHPGASLPTGSLDDDTFTFADALLGDETLVPPGSYGLQQQFLDVADKSIHNAIGSTLLQRMVTSPTNLVPVEIRTADAALNGYTSAFKGGVVKNTDAYDRALDTLSTPTPPVGVRSRLGKIVHDGVRIHNTGHGFDPLRYTLGLGVNEPLDTGDGSWEIRNSWVSYGRWAAINNDHFMSGTIEDCLIDGCHTFMRCRNPASSVDRTQNIIEIRNCLIWLRMLPYPFGHGGEQLPSYPLASPGSGTAWGHGPIFDWHTNGPAVKIYDSTFYVEYYPATTGDNADWIANADDNLGFINSFGTKLIDASNVKLVWAGPGSTWPGTIPAAHSSAFTTYTYTEDPDNPDTHFFTPRNDWITAHPVVGTVGDTDFDGAIDWSTQTNAPYIDYPTF
jgi:hypothetical protein